MVVIVIDLLNGVYCGVFYLLGTLSFLLIAVLNFVNYTYPIQRLCIEVIYFVAMIFYLIGTILMLISAIIQNKKKNEHSIDLTNKNVQQTELKNIIVIKGN
jgi:hypothetical protein